ncbi:MAG: methionine--tRNA ligase [Actinobacteria bacterium]|nr:methionine--tRNA ligase [Actinomycetota bacterium]
MTRHVLVAVAWPYANGVQHLGHIAGAYLPADIFARYHRITGNRVLMVSGSDAHGTPIMVAADEESITPAEVVDRYHPRIVEQWDVLAITFDLFTSTRTDNHREVTWQMFRALHANGYLETRTTEQFFDPERQRFLPDRYVEGTCPYCGNSQARGDQCDNCGRTLDPVDLIDPRSKLSGATPEPRETEHYFLLLTKLQEPVATWLDGLEGWRNHVINWARGFLGEGLQDRAITRDLDWGVPIPPELDISTEASEKRIYVWFEAVIGYLSASKEWAQRSGDAEAWRAWWEDPDAETYYFVGKDNIPFHAVFWPAQLIGSGDLNLPTNVPANQYVTFKGEKASKSRGIGTPVVAYLDTFTPDALRYGLAANLPEYTDTDISEAELARRVNDELANDWGNLVNRVFALVGRNCDGRVPELGELDGPDAELLDRIDALLGEEGELIERVELRAALKKALEAAQATNAYLNALEPWKTAKTDAPRTAQTLAVALAAIAGIAVGFAPYTPFSSDRVLQWLGVGEAVRGEPGGAGAPSGVSGWRRPDLVPGTQLGDAEPLFPKIELPNE